jgi:hypothetical protein
MDGTIIGVGNFTQIANNPNPTIMIPSAADILKVTNWTQIAVGAGGNISLFQWNSNLANQGVIDPTQGYTIAQNGAVRLSAVNSFVIYNPNTDTYETVGAARPITNINGPAGIVDAVNVDGLQAGSIVRFSGLTVAGIQQVGGIDFVVNDVGVGQFTVTFPTPTAFNNATGGFYSIVSSPNFVPQISIINDITRAAQAVVTTASVHGLQVGQTIRLFVPQVGGASYGMTQLNGQIATVVAVIDPQDFAININTTGYGLFAFPPSNLMPFTPAYLTPFGDNSAVAFAQVPPLSSLEDSVRNQGFIGMTLLGGANNPAGVAGDFITWEAYKAMYGGI